MSNPDINLLVQRFFGRYDHSADSTVTQKIKNIYS